jgi:hypothetical protein
MNIGKKIYYEKATGFVLVDTGERSGNVIETTTEQDYEIYVALSERVPASVGVLHLEHGQYAHEFSTCIDFHVDIETGELKFNFSDPGESPVVYSTYPALDDVVARQEATEAAILLLMDIGLEV